MFKRVLLCYDGSETGRRALRRGADLAIQLGSKVFVLSVVPPEEMDPNLIASAAGHACVAECNSTRYRKLMDESVQWLQSRGVSAEGFLTSGNTLDEISTHANRLEIDLIVLGHYPQPAGGFWWTKGSRSTLAERVDCCILMAIEPGKP